MYVSQRPPVAFERRESRQENSSDASVEKRRFAARCVCAPRAFVVCVAPTVGREGLRRAFATFVCGRIDRYRTRPDFPAVHSYREGARKAEVSPFGYVFPRVRSRAPFRDSVSRQEMRACGENPSGRYESDASRGSKQKSLLRRESGIARAQQ